jgi:intracellular multiplication protein IcmL
MTDTTDALIAVLKRNAFYKRQYLLALCALCLSFIMMVVLGWVLYFLLQHPARPLYFATDKVGRLIQIVPVTQPNMTTQQVITWAIRAVEDIYSYDYVNYHSQLQSAQKYFTNYGWTKYMNALTLSNNLLALEQRKMIIIANVVEQPTLLAQGLLGGSYAWKLQMPVLVTYWLPPYDTKSKFSNPLNITMLIQRQPELQSYQGLGILQIIGSFATASSFTQAQEISNKPELS